jgi:hypothetical protein
MRRTRSLADLTVRSARGAVDEEATERGTYVRFTGDVDAGMRGPFDAVVVAVASGAGPSTSICGG